MLDVISGGRIISGFVRGTGNEYHSYGIDPSTSRERFWEAHDLIIKAWTEPGPVRLGGQVLQPAVREPVAAAAAGAASADLAAGLRVARDDRRGGEAQVHVHAGLLAAGRPQEGARHVPPARRGEVRLRGEARAARRCDRDLRRRDRRAGAPRGAAARDVAVPRRPQAPAVLRDSTRLPVASSPSRTSSGRSSRRASRTSTTSRTTS